MEYMSQIASSLSGSPMRKIPSRYHKVRVVHIRTRKRIKAPGSFSLSIKNQEGNLPAINLAVSSSTAKRIGTHHSFLLSRNLETDPLVGILKENSLMRKKISEYEEYRKRSSIDSLQPAMSFDHLKNRFNKLASGIRYLLKYENGIEEINTSTEYRLTLNPNAKKYYRVHAKLQTIPLKLYGDVGEGGGGRIMFSRGIPRPLIQNCDKIIRITSKTVIGSYEPSMKLKRFFTEEFIYFTVEAFDTLKFTFQCVFGNGNLLISRFSRSKNEYKS